MHIPKNKIFKAVAVLILLSFLAANSKTITSPVRAALTDFSAMPLALLHNISQFAKKLIPFSSLREENRLLRERIGLLGRRIEEAKALYGENQRLKEVLGFKKDIPYTTVAAEVIGRDPTNWSNSVIIDKGTIDGVRQDKAALSTRGLVGRVFEAGRYSARILLVTDPNSKVGVLIQRNRQGGILVGMPDGICKMIYISLDSDVAKGDKIITAGFGRVFPKGILVGEVVQVGKEPGRLYKYAIVKTSQDMSKLEEVLCIR